MVTIHLNYKQCCHTHYYMNIIILSLLFWFLNKCKLIVTRILASLYHCISESILQSSRFRGFCSFTNLFFYVITYRHLYVAKNGSVIYTYTHAIIEDSHILNSLESCVEAIWHLNYAILPLACNLTCSPISSSYGPKLELAV